jgi:hypothetical protein
MNRIPKKLNIGDRVYFVKHNKIDSSMKVIDIEIGQSKLCEVTNRLWSGWCQLLINDMKDENLHFKVKGFQGFRYKWWED